MHGSQKWGGGGGFLKKGGKKFFLWGGGGQIFKSGAETFLLVEPPNLYELGLYFFSINIHKILLIFLA